LNYRSAPNTTIYKRLRIDRGTNEDRIREQIVVDESQQLLQEDHDDDRITFVVSKNASNHDSGVPNPAAVIVRGLHVVFKSGSELELLLMNQPTKSLSGNLVVAITDLMNYH